MATREDIRRREDVHQDDLDDIVGIAAQLQADARAADDDRASVEAVKAVAHELDVEPRFVDEAIRKLTDDRAAKAKAEAEATRVGAIAAASRRRMLAIAAVALAGLLGSGALGAGIVAESGRAAIVEAQRVAVQEEADLVSVLDRQRSLLPQIAAMSGAEVSGAALPADASIAARLQASQDLGVAMAAALAALPPADEAASQQRLNLQYEIVGAQNRIDVERHRWEEAVAEWEAAAATPSGRLAVAFGRADPPR